MEKEVRISVITLGDSGVGKTSIIKRIYDGSFQDTMFSTHGFEDFFVKRKYNKKNLTISLCFKDTAGQERYQELPLQYIRNSHIILLVFCNIETLNTIRERWYQFYKEKSNLDISKFILVGNKSDIFGEEKQEIEKQGQDFAEEINAHFITCSAKSADNMDILEQIIVNEAKGLIDLTEELLNEQNKIQQNNQNFNLDERKNENEKSGCC